MKIFVWPTEKILNEFSAWFQNSFPCAFGHNVLVSSLSSCQFSLHKKPFVIAIEVNDLAGKV